MGIGVLAGVLYWVSQGYSVKEVFMSDAAFEKKMGHNRDYYRRGEDIRRIHLQSALEHEGHLLAEQGKYEEAIQKYQEALKPEYLNDEGDKSGPVYGLMKVHMMQGKYEEALKDLEWYIKRHPRRSPNDVPPWVENKHELDALIQYQKTGDPKAIYQHIEYLKNKWPELTKTKGEVWRKSVVTDQFSSTIIRLYDTIGDQEGGIRYIDELFADAEAQFGKREISEDNEYMKLRRAFEKDKKAGKKGTPTKLIIESDNLTF